MAKVNKNPKRAAVSKIMKAQLPDETVLKMHNEAKQETANFPNKEAFLKWVKSKLSFNPAEVDMEYLDERIWKHFFAGGTSNNAGVLARLNANYERALEQKEQAERLQKLAAMDFEELELRAPRQAEKMNETAALASRTGPSLWENQRKTIGNQAKMIMEKVSFIITQATNYGCTTDAFWTPEGSASKSPYKSDFFSSESAPLLDLLDEIDFGDE